MQIVLLSLLLLWRRWIQRRIRKLSFNRKPKRSFISGAIQTDPKTTAQANTRFQPKPPWVLREVIRLKALMPPDTGCRTIAEQFNRLHGGQNEGATVGRTWVAEKLKTHRYQVLQLRRRLKHTPPRPMPAHRVWAMDMTGVPDTQRKSQTVLGIIDQGSRWLLCLQGLKSKASIDLMRALLDTIEAHDFKKPEHLRTDNEAVFTSRLFRFGLWWLGIRHQRTDRGCPWMNGRIERLFGTLKTKTRGLQFDPDALPDQLRLFRFWYNHVRPHQYLEGRTPQEALSRLPAQRAGGKTEPEWFKAWNGRLGGYWFPPG